MLIPLLYIVFVLAAIVLIVIILIQEGKGGGLGGAFGGQGQETFGVGAKGINTVTMYTAIVFLGSALFIHVLHRTDAAGSILDVEGGEAVEAPLDAGAPPPTAPTPPAGG